MLSIVGCFLIFTNAAAFFSTLFDFDNDPEDEYSSTDFPCFNVGSLCYVTSECCKPATCVLPAWSPTPVCLVPGYQKHPEIMVADNPVRVKDIIHVRNLYNTTHFDLLLRNYISELNSSETLVHEHLLISNTTNELDLDSEIISNNGNSTEYQVSINDSNTNNDLIDFSGPILEKDSQELISIVEPKCQDLFNTSSSENLRKSLQTFSQNLSAIFQSSVQFLLLNSTIVQSDHFKDVVKIIQDKLIRLNENENKCSNSTKDNKTISSSNNEKSIVKSSAVTLKSKVSVWDIVKNFFLTKNETLNEPKIIAIGTLAQIPLEKVAKESSNIADHEDIRENISLGIGKIFSEKVDNGETETKFIDRFYDSKELSTILKNSEKIEPINLANLNAVSDENVFEIYNIDIPYNSGHENEIYNSKYRNIVQQSVNSIDKNLKQAVEHNPHTETLLNKYSNKQPENYFQTRTYKLLRNQTNKLHRAYSWPTYTNITRKFKTELKNIFIWKKQKGNVIKNKLTSGLDEKYLYTINRKNDSQKVSDSSSTQSERTSSRTQSERTSSDYSFGYSSSVESASSGSEDLYNNSYVFVMPKDKTKSARRNSSWRSLLNFLHISQIKPDTKSNNTSKSMINHYGSVKLTSKVDMDTVIDNPTGKVSINISKTEVAHDVIRLPEYLMPDVLERRQANETDLLFFDDSNENEENYVEERDSTNSTFFLFFKW